MTCNAIIQRLKCNNNKNKGWHAIIIIIKVDMQYNNKGWQAIIIMIKVDMQLNDLVNFLLCNNIKYAVLLFSGCYCIIPSWPASPD